VYLRFAVYKLDEDSGEPRGIFQAVSDLSAAGLLTDYEETLYQEVWNWFRRHLKAPTRLARASSHSPKEVAICWFKAEAREHIAQARQLVRILEDHDLRVSQLTTHRPGYIVYEDECQIAAEPFRNSRNKIRGARRG
jgi:hypothetical protein